jgi:ubiquinone/menaquinone biosynthesis C-methylase UbiE
VPTPAGFDRSFRAISMSETYRRVEREAFGDDYAEGFDPFSFTTRSELNVIGGLLEIGRGQTLVDIACGQGGPGLFVAQSTGASVIGVDFSPVGVAQAETRAAAMGLADHARYVVADAASTGLPNADADAALSIDALQLMPDKAAVLGEIHRILRTRARFALTTWESPTSDAGAFENANHQPLRALLLEAGFRVELYEPTPAWRRIAQAMYSSWLREKESLVSEMGAEAYAPLEKEASESLPKMLEDEERVLIVSRAI